MYHSPASIIHTEVAIGCHPPTGTIWVRPRAARPAAPRLFALTSLPPPRLCLLAPYIFHRSDTTGHDTTYSRLLPRDKPSPLSVTRFPYNLRSIAHECVHLVTYGHFRSRNKDGGHTVRSAVSENPTLHENFL